MNDARVICGDARDVVAHMTEDPARVVLLTDPVWPNAPEDLKARLRCEDPETTLAQVLEVARARRVVIWLGCESDPRFLRAVPERWPFLRVCWLRYSVPARHGCVLCSGDVAYVFGAHERPDGARMLPGECTSNLPTGNDTRSEAGDAAHPCPRKMEHAVWLVRWCTMPGDLVLDPFAGSGVIGAAAVRMGRRYLGIEHIEQYAELARQRIAAEVAGSSLQHALSGQGALFGETP